MWNATAQRPHMAPRVPLWRGIRAVFPRWCAGNCGTVGRQESLDAELLNVEFWARARASSVVHNMIAPFLAPEWRSLPATCDMKLYSATIPANSRDEKQFSAFCSGVRQVSNATESSRGSVARDESASSAVPDARGSRKQNEQMEADFSNLGEGRRSAGRKSTGARRNSVADASTFEEADSESDWRRELRGRVNRRAVRESEPQHLDSLDSDTQVGKGAPIGLDKFASEWEPDLHSPDWLRAPPPEIDDSDLDSRVQELEGSHHPPSPEPQPDSSGTPPPAEAVSEGGREKEGMGKRSVLAVMEALRGGGLGGGLEEEEEEDGVGGDVAAVPLELQRSLRIGIVGPPNAGKSVLTNRLVGTKVSAVSRKTNCTRSEILGFTTRGDTQLLYFDTPGLSSERSHYPSSNDSRRMMARSWEVVERCDLLLLLIDAERHLRMPDKRVDRLLSLIGSELPAGQTRVVGLNKVDLVKDKRRLLSLAAQMEGLMAFDQLFMISALKGRGIGTLENYFEEEAVLRPWEEDSHKVTRQSPVDMAQEIVRECLLDRLHQELPYRVQQRQVSRKQLADGSMRIEMELAVDTEGQRGILVGQGGQSIRQIGIAAREQLEVIFGVTVHLILRAVVRKQR